MIVMSDLVFDKGLYDISCSTSPLPNIAIVHEGVGENLDLL